MRSWVRWLGAAAAVLLLGALLLSVFIAGLGCGYAIGRLGRDGPLGWLPVPAVASEGAIDEGTGQSLGLGHDGTDGGSAPQVQDSDGFQVFWEAWGLVQDHFDGDLPDMQAVTHGAIDGMLRTLGDENTILIRPSEAAVMGEDATGAFEGIGAYVDSGDAGGITIVDVFRDGPADRAGLRAGDRVLAVDGVSLDGKTLYECIALIRGPAGSQVTLLVVHEGAEGPFEVVVTRSRIEIPLTTVEMRDDGVGYIRLTEFSSTADQRMAEGLRQLLAEDPKGIVLDLRQNPGGWLDQAINVADLFLDEGPVLTERAGAHSGQVYSSDPGDLAELIPLVVLVDGGTASASEIVAGAIQDRERGTLIGETTYGKGSVQRVFALSDGSELRVTIAHWYTPDGRGLQDQGLTPDIVVPWATDEDASSDSEDPQLERAVQYLLTGD